MSSSLFVLLLAGPLACGGEKGETDSDTVATDGPATDTSDQPTDGMPAECGEAEYAPHDVFEVLLDGEWKPHEFVVPCTIDAVTEEMGKSITSMSCDETGAPVAVTLKLPVATEGDVAWAVGDMLTLHSRYEDLDVTAEREFQLRGIDDNKLWAAGLALGGPLKSEIFQPLTVASEAVCGPMELDGPIRSYRLDFELEGQPPLSLFTNQRGEIAAEAGESLVIDVANALYNTCCHDTQSFTVFVRRVKTG